LSQLRVDGRTFYEQNRSSEGPSKLKTGPVSQFI